MYEQMTLFDEIVRISASPAPARWIIQVNAKGKDDAGYTVLRSGAITETAPGSLGASWLLDNTSAAYYLAHGLLSPDDDLFLYAYRVAPEGSSAPDTAVLPSGIRIQGEAVRVSFPVLALANEYNKRSV